MKHHILFLALNILVLFSCSMSSESHKDYAAEEEMMAATTEATPEKEDMIASSAASTVNDSTKQFIRTARMKFRTKNIRRTSLQIENIVYKNNGFVTYTHLSSSNTYTNLVPVSEDSSLQVIHYTLHNSIKFRVPNQLLDTTLRAIAQYIDYMDYRTIEAEDVSLSMEQNKLTQKRISKHTKRMEDAIQDKGEKLNDMKWAEKSLLEQAENKDKATLSTLRIEDKIKYSTVDLEVYELPAAKRTLVANYKNIEGYKPSTLSKMADAFKSGWNAILSIIIGIFHIWPFLLIAAGILIAYRKWGKKKSSKA